MVATIIFVLVGVALWVAAGVVLYFRGRTRGKAAAMGAVETSSAVEAASLAPGSPVEVKGTLRCEAPLESELAGETCAYYSSRAIREYETTTMTTTWNRTGDRRRSPTASGSRRSPSKTPRAASQ